MTTLDRRVAAVLIVSVGLVAAISFAIVPAGALAALPGRAWEISSVARPTNFSVADNAKCSGPSSRICDEYMITLTNVGTEPTNGPVSIADALPKDLIPINMVGANLKTHPGSTANGFGWSCNPATTTCTYSEPVEAGATLAVILELEVEEGVTPGEITNVVHVTGGAAAPVATSEPLTLPNTVEGPFGRFGIAAFGFAAHDAGGGVDTQAGDHPPSVTTTVDLNTGIESRLSGARIFASAEPPKDLVVYLPLGLLGNPTAAARCTELQLVAQAEAYDKTECPSASRLGTVTLFSESGVESSAALEGSSVTDLYNMRPETGYPGQLGLKVLGKAIQAYISLVHTSAGYALRVATPGIPRAINVEGLAFTLFGDPRVADGETDSSQTFFTNPGNCGGGSLNARAEVDSWAAPGEWARAQSTAFPAITGCNLLQFEPTIAMHPELTQAEAPTGTEIKIKIPQSPGEFPILATPQLKNITMTLPAGMTISPGGGDGLTGCEATGPNGIDIPTDLPNGASRAPTEVGEGEAIGADGMSHLVPGHCPPSSQIGTVEFATPVLESPLEGRIYIAQPACGGTGPSECTAADAADGRLFGLYLEAARSGLVVKLKGSVSVDPTTGRLTARFLENPQLPVSEVTLRIKGGGRAPLANPRQCGAATLSGDLAPWSSPITPDALPTASFPVDWNGAGGPCPATPAFAPTLEAGSTSPIADHFGALTLTVARGDRQQDLARLQVKLPAGLLGMIGKVPLCEEPHAAQGTCPEASNVGSVWAAAGSGAQPLWVHGSVYVTGPYEGAPFGLSIVVPAVAGPFNLGDVVVRSRIDVDEATSALTVTSDPLPQFRDGVPLRIQKLNIAVDREGFIFNPTNCEGKRIETTLESTQGAEAKPSVPFAVEGCKNLPFKPTFKVSTQAKTSEANGASLDVKIASGAGQANLRSVAVSLPRQLPSRLTTIQQACPEATFAQNPALCPAGSDVGTAKAVTPVLNVPVAGPVYIVSHGGAAFPNLVVILQGQGVRLDLTGDINISKQGITSSSFPSAPDAPISSFELKLPEGSHSVLAATLLAEAAHSLCAIALAMPTTIVGQNGARMKQSTKIAVTGCPKTRKKFRLKKH